MLDSQETRAGTAAEPGLGGHSVAHEHAMFAGLAVVFAALVAALVLWFRRASRDSAIEELDRLLDEP